MTRRQRGEALRRAWHARPWACHAGTNLQKHKDKGSDLGRATLARRCGMPGSKVWHARGETEDGVPLEWRGVACQIRNRRSVTR
ncbi:hypothetical protein AHAS_Ahas05G0161800 [Arachis hypogaea]